MPVSEDNFFEVNEYGDGYALSEYNDTIAIVAARKGKDGTIWETWCRKRIGKDKYHDTDLPMGGPRCIREKLAAILCEMLERLLGVEKVVEHYAKVGAALKETNKTPF